MTNIEKGQFDSERNTHTHPFTSEDIRCTQSKDGWTLCAIVLAFPLDGRFAMRSLTENSDNWPDMIARIEMLGHAKKLNFSSDQQGLHLTLPAKTSGDIALALKSTH